MQDLSDRVQAIARNFYQTRSNAAFTIFYKTLLPEANKMLRGFIKDPQTIEDLSSKIFETILIKPSIYFDDDTRKQFKLIAIKYWGVSEEECEIHHNCYKRSTLPVQYGADCYKPISLDDSKVVLANSLIGKLWLLINKPDAYRITQKDHCGNPIKDSREHDCYIRLSLDNLHDFDIHQLFDAPLPFIFDLDKPFLHYFSKIVRTNALSYLKKSRKHQDQQFTDMYSGYDDDDRPQLVANQMSDEHDKVETLAREQRRMLDKQKLMIIYDIIQISVPESQRAIMIDAILLNMDYAKIAQKHGLIKIMIEDDSTFAVTNIEDSGYITYDDNGVEKSILIRNLPDLKMRMDAKYRITGIDSQGIMRKCRLIDGTGCLKSRVHRFKKRLDQEIATIPQFTLQCNLGTYSTYYSENRIRTRVDVVETESNGSVQTIYHGRYVNYYSTGEVKEMGRYHRNKRQGIWYSFFKDGSVMKRGLYSMDKQDGRWHYFDNDGLLNSMISFHLGERTYYEMHQEDGQVVSGMWDSPLLPTSEPKPPLNEILASKLCAQYDCELAYPAIHFEIS